jgi:hypothetical protein
VVVVVVVIVDVKKAVLLLSFDKEQQQHRHLETTIARSSTTSTRRLSHVVSPIFAARWWSLRTRFTRLVNAVPTWMATEEPNPVPGRDRVYDAVFPSSLFGAIPSYPSRYIFFLLLLAVGVNKNKARLLFPLACRFSQIALP